MSSTHAAPRPPIQMIDSEADALADLAMGIEHRQPQVSALLLQEIDRAETYSADDMPDDVVTMLSRVVFVDQRTGGKREVSLVYPKDADIAEGRVSILTPVGAGLIGLRVGQSISWPDRSGEERLLTIESVVRPG